MGGRLYPQPVGSVFTPTHTFHLHAPSTSAQRDCHSADNAFHFQVPTWSYGSLTLDNETDIINVTRDDHSSSQLEWLATALAPCIAPWSERRCQVSMIGPHVQRSAYSGLLWARPKHGQPGSSCTIRTLPDFQGDEASLGSRLILGLERRSDLSF